MYIKESGLIFGPYKKERLFHLEKANLYQQFKQKPKIAEFIVLTNRRNLEIAWIVEAKSSIPHISSIEEHKRFIEEIIEKWKNAFYLFSAVHCGIQIDDFNEVGLELMHSPLKSLRIGFMLVISGAKDEWLIPLSDDLKPMLSDLCKIYKLSLDNIIVASGDFMIKKGFCSNGNVD